MRSTIETLAASWRNSGDAADGNVYLKPGEVKRLIGRQLKEIETALAGRPYSDSVMQQIRGASRVSMTARFYQFFDEIGLTYGQREKAVIGAGSQGAHTLALDTDEDIGVALRDRNGLRTLLDRVFLKHLAYGGPYIDRSVLGWPERDIDEPLGDPLSE